MFTFIGGDFNRYYMSLSSTGQGVRNEVVLKIRNGTGSKSTARLGLIVLGSFLVPVEPDAVHWN